MHVFLHIDNIRSLVSCIWILKSPNAVVCRSLMLLSHTYAECAQFTSISTPLASPVTVFYRNISVYTNEDDDEDTRTRRIEITVRTERIPHKGNTMLDIYVNSSTLLSFDTAIIRCHYGFTVMHYIIYWMANLLQIATVFESKHFAASFSVSASLVALDILIAQVSMELKICIVHCICESGVSSTTRCRVKSLFPSS